MFNIEKIIPINPNINFLSIRKLMIFFSVSFLIITLFLLIIRGLNLGIDFKGGVLIEAKIENTTISDLRQLLSNNFDDVTIQEFGSKNIVLIRLQNNKQIDIII